MVSRNESRLYVIAASSVAETPMAAGAGTGAGAGAKAGLMLPPQLRASMQIRARHGQALPHSWILRAPTIP